MNRCVKGPPRAKFFPPLSNLLWLDVDVHPDQFPSVLYCASAAAAVAAAAPAAALSRWSLAGSCCASASCDCWACSGRTTHPFHSGWNSRVRDHLRGRYDIFCLWSFHWWHDAAIATAMLMLCPCWPTAYLILKWSEMGTSSPPVACEGFQNIDYNLKNSIPKFKYWGVNNMLWATRRLHRIEKFDQIAKSKIILIVSHVRNVII